MKTTTEIDLFAAYLDILENTPCYEAVTLIYDSYIENDPRFITEQGHDVSIISAALDEKVNTGTVTNGDLADYEEAARRAGFYAGFKAAIAYIHLLQRQQI